MNPTAKASGLPATKFCEFWVDVDSKSLGQYIGIDDDVGNKIYTKDKVMKMLDEINQYFNTNYKNVYEFIEDYEGKLLKKTYEEINQTDIKNLQVKLADLLGFVYYFNKKS